MAHLTQDSGPLGRERRSVGSLWRREAGPKVPRRASRDGASRDGASGDAPENPFLPDAEWYNPLLFVGFPSVTVMPKQKTNKATKKRFRVSKNGKVKRNRPGRRHLLSCKSTKRKRNLRKQQICPKADGERVLRLLLQA